MTGYKWVCYPRKIWNVIQQRWGGVFITGSTQWLCHEKGGPKAALSQSNSQSGNALTNAFSLGARARRSLGRSAGHLAPQLSGCGSVGAALEIGPEL